jgi:hypothetical protein
VYLTWIEARRASHPLAGVRRRLPHTRGSQLASVFSLHDVIVLTGRDSATIGADRSGQVLLSGDEGMVEPVGIEPTTPCLQSRCSPG